MHSCSSQWRNAALRTKDREKGLMVSDKDKLSPIQVMMELLYSKDE
ncbi:MAG: hypothetical protein ETSY2_42935 [Candidatus Entotheonella gemina]|uniref:Uncharacterized protein n=1 Tax=Candidatus Entotheonella gemina TaxID=1429439 RepID=W4LJW1_9BACT|nr:MAG: hypothetical protein ETSY2_42935 [Candidatus Entotheonella gemina]